MNELDAVVTVVNRQLINIDNSQDKKKIRLGKMGELFVKYGVKQCLFDKGFSVGKKGDKTFTIKPHHRSDEREQGGIDHYLKFRVNRWSTYRCFIEVKNWQHMRKGISDSIFKKEILNRFKMHDILRRRYWILVINKRNVRYIEDKCKKSRINIIPIEEHITSQFLSTLILKPIMEDFIKDVIKVVDDIISKRIKKGILLYLISK